MRFQLWDEAVTVTTANVRRDANGEKVGVYPAGTRLIITGGPVERNHLTWWQVRNGFTGWAAEDAPNGSILLDKWDPSNFGRAMRFVLGQEGGYLSAEEAAEIGDAGGATRWGIAQKFNPQVNVATMELDQAKRIYRDKYWQPVNGDNLPWPLALTVFDFAVNAGVATALELLKILSDFAAYNDGRRAYYRSLKQFGVFGQGWLNRVDAIEKFS